MWTKITTHPSTPLSYKPYTAQTKEQSAFSTTPHNTPHTKIHRNVTLAQIKQNIKHTLLQSLHEYQEDEQTNTSNIIFNQQINNQASVTKTQCRTLA